MGLVRCYSRDNFAVADPGGGATPLILDQTEARKAEKKFFCDRASPLSQGLDDRPSPPPPQPPYLKIWIRHCFVHRNDPKKLPA